MRERAKKSPFYVAYTQIGNVRIENLRIKNLHMRRKKLRKPSHAYAYVRNLSLTRHSTATGHKRGSNNDAGIIREQIMVLLYISVSSYWS